MSEISSDNTIALTIDAQAVEVPPGATLLEAARQAGIEIPTMCFLPGRPASTSCMVCVVKVQGHSPLLPACGTKAEPGMVVESETPEVHAARRAALELLLSEHVGDCLGPCHLACPAQMNIPLMLRQIAAGQLNEAIATVKQDIALPAVLGRICPAPCEKACRRRTKDNAVAICLLKRYVADVDLATQQPYQPVSEGTNGKRVAIVGAGPAGLSAAYYLARRGHACTLFDDHDQPGGMVRYSVDEEQLPREVLDAEIATITNLAVQFKPQCTLGHDISLATLRSEFDAVLIAIGQVEPADAGGLGLTASDRGVQAQRRTFQTELPDVFAAGSAVRPTRLAVRACADGRQAATAIDQYLTHKPLTGETPPFNSRMGKLQQGEIDVFTALANAAARVENGQVADDGLRHEQARTEAERCLHCDCRKADRCQLREQAQAYQATVNRYGSERPLFTQLTQHADLIFEPGKCIKCGICLTLAREAAEPLGLSFIGRGFDVRVAPPFDESLADALTQAAKTCVERCPTGALAWKNQTISG